MSHHDGLPHDMHQPLASLGSPPPPVDWATLDRLLAGRLDPGDAPPGYEAMARLVAAATPPVAADELAGEQAAVAQFLALTRAHPPTPTRSRSAPPSRLVRVKAAAVLVVAALSIGGVAAAATGRLPRPAPVVADRAAPTVPSGPTVRPPTRANATAADPAATTVPPRTTSPTRSQPDPPAALAHLTRVLITAERHGTVDPAASDLLDQAGDVVRAVAEGHSEEARKRLEDLKRKTEELIQKGQIRPTATGRVRQAVAHLSRAVHRSR